jgi:hypothetical protein
MKPDRVNIFGKEYKIIYCDKAGDVDKDGYAALWGQIDYWTCTIRIYDNGELPDEAIFESIIHEILHGVAVDLKLKCFNGDEGHNELQLVAMALTDVLSRNGWLKE